MQSFFYNVEVLFVDENRLIEVHATVEKGDIDNFLDVCFYSKGIRPFKVFLSTETVDKTIVEV